VFVCILPEKAVPEMTYMYTVSGGTLNPSHSLTHSLAVDMKFPIHIHIHRFSEDIDGYIHNHRRLSCVHAATKFLQNTAVQDRLLPNMAQLFPLEIVKKNK